MNQIKLTIGIPTYNRPRSLENTLSQLQEAGIFSNQEIIVKVHDNSDENNAGLNKDICKQFKSEYIKNAKNLGFGGNLIQIISEARSEFLWYLSDDDNLILDNLRCFASNLDCLYAGCINMVPYISDSIQAVVYNSSEGWSNNKTLSDLVSIKFPFILFSSFILPISTLQEGANRELFLREISPLKNNSYVQTAIPLVLQNLSRSVLYIKYLANPLINYTHARVGRFTLPDLYNSMFQIYSLMHAYNIISNSIVGIRQRRLKHWILLMLCQHKAGLKVIEGADSDALWVIHNSLDSFYYKTYLMLILYFVLTPKQMKKLMLKRGHQYVY